MSLRVFKLFNAHFFGLILSITNLYSYEQLEQSLVADDKKSYYFARGHELKVEVVLAKRDGPIVYVEDVNEKLYSFKLNNDNKLERIRIFEAPVIGSVYNILVNQPNYYTLPKDQNGKKANWSIAFVDYVTEKAKIITPYIMISTNPIKFRNLDPRLLPNKSFEHLGPLGMVGVSHSSSGERLAVIGYNAKGKKILAYRKINFDLSGSNPFMTYRMVDGDLIHPFPYMKQFGKFIGTSSKIVDIQVNDWHQVKLRKDHLPIIRVMKEGRTIHVGRSDGYDVYDCKKSKWVDRIKDSSVDNKEWPFFEEPKIKKNKKILMLIDGKVRSVALSGADPLFGFYKDEKGEKHFIFYMIESLQDAISNKKHFYDESYNRIKVKLLTTPDF